MSRDTQNDSVMGFMTNASSMTAVKRRVVQSKVRTGGQGTEKTESIAEGVENAPKVKKPSPKKPAKETSPKK